MRLFDGDIPITNIDQGFEQAESLITRANDHFGNADSMRQFQSNDPPGEGACVPIRWVLNDVIFHCDSLWKERGVFTSRDSFPRPSDVNNQFGLNTDTEYNIYIMTHNEASGEANGLGGSANSMVTNGFSRGLFNHEMGHVLGLRHSWGFDRIDDTPETAFDFDLNCDGTISSSEMNL